MKPVVPAEKAELLSVAKAMHRENFAKNVKALFHLEKEAALKSIETGVGGTRLGLEVRQEDLPPLRFTLGAAWLCLCQAGGGLCRSSSGPSALGSVGTARTQDPPFRSPPLQTLFPLLPGKACEALRCQLCP